MDRQRRREWALCQTERLLRQERHQDGRLRAGHRAGLFRVAEEDGQLLCAAGHGRRDRLDLSPGLVPAARAARGVLQKTQSPAEAATDAAGAERGRPILPGPNNRRQDCLWTVPVHGAWIRRDHHGVTNVLYDYGFEYENPGKPYEMQGF